MPPVMMFVLICVPLEPLQGGPELRVARPGGVAVRGVQQVIGFEADGLGNLAPWFRPAIIWLMQ